MDELGIEIVQPAQSETPPDAAAPADSPNNLPLGAVSPGENPAPSNASSTAQQTTQPGALTPAKQGATHVKAASPAKSAAQSIKMAAQKALSASDVRLAALRELWKQAKTHTDDLALVPLAFFILIIVQRICRRSRKHDPFGIPLVGSQPQSEAEPYDVVHSVQSLSSEEFEWLVALIYRRKGYRVSVSQALSGGRGGDFMLVRKSERLLVQCKNRSVEERIDVDKVRELHDAVVETKATRGVYVASCGFTWDARHFAKAKAVTLINARTLDALITEARESAEENLLDVSRWIPGFLSKVQWTKPLCPTCEAAMDEVFVNGQPVWLCSERPDCRGRRSGRKIRKAVSVAQNGAEAPAEAPTLVVDPDATPPRQAANAEPVSAAGKPAPKPIPEPDRSEPAADLQDVAPAKDVSALPGRKRPMRSTIERTATGWVAIPNDDAPGNDSARSGSPALQFDGPSTAQPAADPQPADSRKPQTPRDNSGGASSAAAPVRQPAPAEPAPNRPAVPQPQPRPAIAPDNSRTESAARKSARPPAVSNPQAPIPQKPQSVTGRAAMAPSTARVTGQPATAPAKSGPPEKPQDPPIAADPAKIPGGVRKTILHDTVEPVGIRGTARPRS